MERNIAIVLTVFAIGYFTAIILATGTVNFELPINANGEVIDNIVELKDGIIIQGSLTTEQHVPHPLVGTIVTSEDGSTCWIVTEKFESFYYKILEECPVNEQI